MTTHAEHLTRLLGGPTAAALSVYRADGAILQSPVWFRATGEWVEIVVAEGDAKLERLRVDPRCVFLAFETVPPFAGLQLRADAVLDPSAVREARLEIATKYLGAEGGRRYVEARTKPGVVVRLPLAAARTWNLRAILPD